VWWVRRSAWWLGLSCDVVTAVLYLGRCRGFLSFALFVCCCLPLCPPSSFPQLFARLGRCLWHGRERDGGVATGSHGQGGGTAWSRHGIARQLLDLLHKALPREVVVMREFHPVLEAAEAFEQQLFARRMLTDPEDRVLSAFTKDADAHFAYKKRRHVLAEARRLVRPPCVLRDATAACAVEGTVSVSPNCCGCVPAHRRSWWWVLFWPGWVVPTPLPPSPAHKRVPQLHPCCGQRGDRVVGRLAHIVSEWRRSPIHPCTLPPWWQGRKWSLWSISPRRPFVWWWWWWWW